MSLDTGGSLIPPFVWPDPRTLSGQWSQRHPALEPLVCSAQTLHGIVSGVDADGVKWLERLLESYSNFNGNLLLALYPACPTRRHELTRLFELQRFFGERIQFRVLVSELVDGAANDSLCCVMPDHEAYLLTGVPSNFGLRKASAGMVGAAVRCDAVLVASWNHWFDYVWETSAPLGPATLDVPHLVPAQGDPAAAEAWQEYLLRCQHVVSAGQQTSDSVVDVDPNTGAVKITTTEGTRAETASQKLGVLGADELSERIARLFCAGEMVTVDKASRLRPLDAPMKAEWFGISGSRQVGRISREVRYRISAIDKWDLEELEKSRKMAGRLLEVLSYPLADGVRWMPNKARPLFFQEMGRVDSEGMERLSRLVSGDPTEFVEKQRQKIIEDANEMYQDFYGPGRQGYLPDHVIAEIISDLTGRLTEAVTSRRLLPLVTFTPLGLGLGGTSEKWVSQWGQSLALLTSVAQYPRELLTNRFFLSQVYLDDDDLLDAMDVCGDSLIADLRNRSQRGSKDRARDELVLLKEFQKVTGDSRAQCEAILSLIDGDRGSAIRHMVETAAKDTGSES